ncbi:hypothetical protein PFLUV_G00164910 [Perca fluviatilis]|uniref:Uncharacterized protein n=1 Tax=Perca fluviatilis TaxID=8168 RepID=A0A6A5EI55_PERFL|nr:hypothetical protein PFLUV_G00164910 [Perca fluviatilis]
MAVGSILSPEHCSLSPVQCRYIHGEEAPKYQSVRKRSSKDRYPPEMAFVRTGHRDVFDTCQELEGYFQHATYIFVFKTANEEKEMFCSSSDRKQSARHRHLPDSTVTGCH